MSPIPGWSGSNEEAIEHGSAAGADRGVGRAVRRSERVDKKKVLDEFVELAGYHRKHAIRLLSRERGIKSSAPGMATRLYDEAVITALTIIWEAAASTAVRIAGSVGTLESDSTGAGRNSQLEVGGDTEPSPAILELDQFVRSLEPRGAMAKSGLLQERRSDAKPHTWGTRSDPYEEVWPVVLRWLNKEPHSTAKSLFRRRPPDVVRFWQMLIRVLLIEDDPSFGELCQVLLARANPVVRFDLQWETTLSAALAYLKEHWEERVDVIILDLGLPDSQGAASVSMLAETFPSVPFLVLSGESDDTVMWDVIRGGAEDHIVKSEVKTETLTIAVLNAIARHLPIALQGDRVSS